MGTHFDSPSDQHHKAVYKKNVCGAILPILEREGLFSSARRCLLWRCCSAGHRCVHLLSSGMHTRWFLLLMIFPFPTSWRKTDQNSPRIIKSPWQRQEITVPPDSASPHSPAKQVASLEMWPAHFEECYSRCFSFISSLTIKSCALKPSSFVSYFQQFCHRKGKILTAHSSSQPGDRSEIALSNA